MIDLLADLCARLSPEEVRMAAYLLRGRGVDQHGLAALELRSAWA
jgi:hypothetical protein